MSLFSLLSIARDGLSVSTAGVDVASQNINNINTPGYVRRRALIQQRGSERGPQGGVIFAGIDRVYDQFAAGRVLTENGKRAAADARSHVLTDIEAVVAPGTGLSISDRISAFYSSFSALSQDADDPTARESVLAKASDVTAAFNNASNQIAQVRSEQLSMAQTVASEVNTRLAQVAVLNQKIADSESSGSTAADLRDQRNQILSELGERIEVRAVEDKSGRVTVFSSGTALVDGSRASTLSVSEDASGEMSIRVSRNGSTSIDITSRVVSGTLGGIREARDTDLGALVDQLDQFAYDFASSVNLAHTTGYGLDGATGRPLFTPPTGVSGAAGGLRVDASVLGNPDSVAATSDPTQLPSGNDVALSIAALAYAPLGSGGPPDERFAAIAGDFGLRKTSADSELTLRESTLAQATSLRDTVSGVNLEEEIVELSKFQRAFEASMKVFQTADQLLQGLLQEL